MSIAFQCYCSACFHSLAANSGYVCSCSCFMCDECYEVFETSRVNNEIRCLACKKSNIRAVPINAKMPQEVKSCLADVSQKIDALTDVLKFQIKHYKKCLSSACDQISSLQEHVQHLEHRIAYGEGTSFFADADAVRDPQAVPTTPASRRQQQQQQQQQQFPAAAPPPLALNPQFELNPLPQPLALGIDTPSSTAFSLSHLHQQEYHIGKAGLGPHSGAARDMDDMNRGRGRGSMTRAIRSGSEQRPVSAASLWKPQAAGHSPASSVHIPQPHFDDSRSRSLSRPSTTQNSSSAVHDYHSLQPPSMSLDRGDMREGGSRKRARSPSSMHAATAQVTPSSLYTSQVSPHNVNKRFSSSERAGAGGGVGGERGWSPTPFAGTKAIGSSQKAMMESARQHFRDSVEARQQQTGYR